LALGHEQAAAVARQEPGSRMKGAGDAGGREQLHAVVLAERGVGAILDELCVCTREHFGIDHATFQVEPVTHRDHEDLGDPH